MKARCCHGLDTILGLYDEDEDDVVLGVEAKQYLVMHIEDPKGLVEKEKGKGIAWATSTLVPQFVEDKIYEEVKKELQNKFKERGSPVSVEIVQSPPQGSRPGTDMLGGALIGAVVTALGFIVVGIVKKKRA